MYDAIGRAALRFAVSYLRRRYRREIRIGILVAFGSLVVAVALAARNVREG